MNKAINILKKIIPDDYNAMVKICSHSKTITLSIDSSVIVEAIQMIKNECDHDFVVKLGECYCQECGISYIDSINNT